MNTPFVLLAALIVTGAATAEPLPVIEVEGQPLAANAHRIMQALDFFGEPLAGDLHTKLQIEITSRNLPQMWDKFSAFLTSVRSIGMDTDQSTLALNTVLRLPEAKPEDQKARAEGLKALSQDFSSRLDGYRQELGPNAYAVFNTLTDIAARPPESTHFQKNRDTIEKRSGRWLKELARQSMTAGFNLDAWVSVWEATGSGLQIPGRN